MGPDTVSESARASRFALLEDRPFRLYRMGQTLSAAGNTLTNIALPFAVLAISHSALDVGLVLLTGQLPVITLTLLGGALGDRRSRRLIMLLSDAARTLVQAATAIALISGRATVPLLVAMQALNGAASAFFAPAATGLIATLAPGGDVRRANSLLGLSATTVQLTALAASGALVAVVGPGNAFAVDAGTFAASTIALARITDIAASPPTGRPGGLGHQLRLGWQAARQRPWLLIYAIHAAALNALTIGPFFVLGPIIATHRLGGAPAWSAIAISYAVGALIAGAVTWRWRPDRPMLAAFTCSAAIVPMLVLLALPVGLSALLPAAALAGLQSSTYNTLTVSCLQANVPDHVLSRASAFTTLGSLAAVPIGMGLAGIAADGVGAPAVLMTGAGFALCAAIAASARPASRASLALATPRRV